MPQINRIRVNNVKYNFGTQFYDDFVMRFSCRNSIYDLANGGGKSVLMLLLLQNLIPNCTLDDKQPVEKLFRTGNASTTIHSLIEWRLDSCDVHNGMKYMTTGFCARKGRDGGEDNGNNSDTATIDYFNYCIFYREFGENDIRNLPLVKDGERITYNGLKAYLRDLEKKDYGVEVKIFERKGDYQNFISNYGLFESQWEIIRGINKTEGHVRTYFENNYKTTRKVVEDLLIEEIIEKSYNNRIRKDSSDDDEMARTLLDIKDKLMELAKRKNEMGDYDIQIDLINEFSRRLEDFKELYDARNTCEKKLVDALLSCRKRLEGRRLEVEELQRKIEELEDSYREEARKVNLAEMEEELIEIDKLDALIKESTDEKALLILEKEQWEKELHNKETANNYADYLEYRRKYDETNELIKHHSMDKKDVLQKLARLAATKSGYVTSRIDKLENQLETEKAAYEAAGAELEKAALEEKNLYGRIKELEGLKAELSRVCDEQNAKLEGLMEGTQVFVAEQAEAFLEESINADNTCKEDIREAENDIEAFRQKLVELKGLNIAYDTQKKNLSEKADSLDEEIKAARQDEETIERLRNTYNSGTNLIPAMEKIFEGLTKELVGLENKLNDLEQYEESLRNGRLPEMSEKFIQVYTYLQGRYKDDIISGRDYVNVLPADEAVKVLEAFPELPYVIICQESYEEIAADKVLNTMNTGASIIPVIKKSALTDESFTLNKDWLAVYQNMGFIWKESALSSELDKVNEEKEQIKERLSKTADRCSMVQADIVFMKTAGQKESLSDLTARRDKTISAIEKADKDIKIVLSDMEILENKLKDRMADLNEAKEKKQALSKDIDLFMQMDGCNKTIGGIYERIRKTTAELSDAHRDYGILVQKKRDRENKYNACRESLEGIAAFLEDIKKDFSENYKRYITKDAKPYASMDEEEVDATAGALRELLNDNGGELADKEKLLATYELSMKKCEQAICYGGMSLEEAGKLYSEGKLNGCGMEDLIKLKDKGAVIERKISEKNTEIDAESAQKNRIEGSVAHAKRQYEEKYGNFVREEINNPQGFIVSHRQEMSGIKSKILETTGRIKEVEESNKDILYMEKDLTKVIVNAGLTLPKPEYIPEETKEFSMEYCESVQKNYEDILKKNNRLRTGFGEEKQNLIDRLGLCHGFELAEEIRTSVNIPESREEVENLIKGLSDTNECIALERDRIDKSIQEMEKIKSSFEDRCVQICCNIRTELDRLPKLSKITLDNEVIPIITLSVPYIKEEMYKDRMSVYIHETVSGAETFSSPDEKLKYIKGRLSWKKLFSVIVSDMNSIRMSLYKREHIKEQSRYLKYEEAVGSTGQSQGIYIQFLIAIINYISSINAAGKDTAVIGKTIFIDNPFGAAKDVYIWEPIFKMLQTNHVQLIVPARGATPAITKMFDVNYILGQKMVSGKQQTVVVDYRSKVQTEEMEYAPLEYHQASFDFGSMQS